MMIQAVYKNCDTLMEAIENSYESGIDHELQLEKMPPEKERAIRFKYHRMLQKLKEENEEIYTARNYIVKEKKKESILIMKKIELGFQENGIMKVIELFDSILEKSDYNLNQFVKGDSLTVYI